MLHGLSRDSEQPTHFEKYPAIDKYRLRLIPRCTEVVGGFAGIMLMKRAQGLSQREAHARDHGDEAYVGHLVAHVLLDCVYRIAASNVALPQLPAHSHDLRRTGTTSIARHNQFHAAEIRTAQCCTVMIVAIRY